MRLRVLDLCRLWHVRERDALNHVGREVEDLAAVMVKM